MENTSTRIDKKRGKAILVVNMTLTFVTTILFWSAIQLFHLEGLRLYFVQIGLYLLLFILALWGLSTEQITLPINTRRILEALIFTLISWLFFLLVIQLLGIAQLQEEFLALRSIPAWKVGANILSTWLFVGFGEEFLFRGYFLNASFRHFTYGPDKRRQVVAVLFVSAFFSIWHLPSRIIWLISGEIDIVLFLISFPALFVLGLGYAYLFIRSDNILLAGLVHGVSDFPLVGMNSQMTPIILVIAIGCVEITRLITRKGGKALQPG
ncbi:MAG: CPBP family intramembrane glutamic endopeptidase [Anaerolineae bacterium]|nr:CPBP family intramembrane metalloprotease [Candidatus Roseilinea sp.]MDW8451050.1 CPBP family intramembrane glutamic endopeptidase [Anaerolineae bacterium]